MRDIFESIVAGAIVVGLFFGAVALFLGAILIMAMGLNYLGASYDVNKMTKIGYEAKIVNVDCVAKYNGRWVDCGALLGNQVEVIQNGQR